MITTIITERDKFPSLAHVETIILPGTRLIQLGKPLRGNYTDFIPKLTYFLKRLGYKKYLQKIFITLHTEVENLKSPNYELPLLLSVLKSVGIFHFPENLIAYGRVHSETLRISTDNDIKGVFSYLRFSSTKKFLNANDVHISEILSKPSHFLLDVYPTKKRLGSTSNKFILLRSKNTHTEEDNNEEASDLKLFIGKFFPKQKIVNLWGRPYLYCNSLGMKEIISLPPQLTELLPTYIDFDAKISSRDLVEKISLLYSYGTLTVTTSGCYCGRRFLKEVCICNYKEKTRYQTDVTRIFENTSFDYAIENNGNVEPVTKEDMNILLTL